MALHSWVLPLAASCGYSWLAKDAAEAWNNRWRSIIYVFVNESLQSGNQVASWGRLVVRILSKCTSISHIKTTCFTHLEWTSMITDLDFRGFRAIGMVRLCMVERGELFPMSQILAELSIFISQFHTNGVGSMQLSRYNRLHKWYWDAPSAWCPHGTT